ncbi:MAG: sensor histidine kinase [Bacteroidota bacterium]
MRPEKNKIFDLEQKVHKLEERIKAYESNEKMFQALVETAVGDIGEDFFNNIVRRLSEWLNAECIIIGQLVEENVVQGFPMYLNGEIIHNFTYNLQGTPCDLTSKKGYCEYVEDVRRYFPTSKDLIDLNAQGYVGIALYNKQGKPNGVLCAISKYKLQLPPQAEDIMRIVGARITTEIERIKAQKALEVSERELKKSNAAKDKLFSIIAHDLNSPFNTLIGFSDLLVSNIWKKDIEKIEKYGKSIHDTASRTLVLLNNLLGWSLSQTGRVRYEPKEINLDELIDETIEYYKKISAHKSITISAEINHPMRVKADADMLSTVLRNLISNAVKYTHDGGNISVSTGQSNGQVVVSVKDNGVGIDPSVKNHLFDLAETSSTPGTNKEKGTGLGLILCKEFIDRHEGELWVESEPDKGSAFHFSLPVS